MVGDVGCLTTLHRSLLFSILPCYALLFTYVYDILNSTEYIKSEDVYYGYTSIFPQGRLL